MLRSGICWILAACCWLAAGCPAGGVQNPGGADQPAAAPPPTPMVNVPAGEFLRGSTKDEEDNIEFPQRKIHLDTFFIDRWEVTVAQYRACLKAGACDKLELPSPRCNWGQADRDDHPVNCVQWEQARTFCRWAHKRLPTEAEWEKAARGTDGRLYPWGDTPPTCEYAVMKERSDGCDKFRTWPVGSKSPAGDSPYGAANMGGNVMEWVQDWFGEFYYKKSPAKNPPGPAKGEYRVLRGGSWYYVSPRSMRTASRHFNAPTYSSAFIGFRCAADKLPEGATLYRPKGGAATQPALPSL